MFRDADLPIQLLIQSRMRDLGLTDWDVARACGYKNVAGGLKALSCTLMSGRIHSFLAPGLPVALGVDQQEFDRAVSETKWMLATRAAEALDRVERQYRKEFCPYVWARFEYGSPRPSMIAVLAGIYAASYAFVPDTRLDPPAVKHRTCRDVFQQHYRKWGPSMPVFGQIIGYYEVIEPGDAGTDLAVPRDTNGNIKGAVRRIERPHFLMTRKSSDTLSNWINVLDQRGGSDF